MRPQPEWQNVPGEEADEHDGSTDEAVPRLDEDILDVGVDRVVDAQQDQRHRPAQVLEHRVEPYRDHKDSHGSRDPIYDAAEHMIPPVVKDGLHNGDDYHNGEGEETMMVEEGGLRDSGRFGWTGLNLAGPGCCLGTQVGSGRGPGGYIRARVSCRYRYIYPVRRVGLQVFV